MWYRRRSWEYEVLLSPAGSFSKIFLATRAGSSPPDLLAAEEDAAEAGEGGGGGGEEGRRGGVRPRPDRSPRLQGGEATPLV